MKSRLTNDLLAALPQTSEDLNLQKSFDEAIFPTSQKGFVFLNPCESEICFCQALNEDILFKPKKDVMFLESSEPYPCQVDDPHPVDEHEYSAMAFLETPKDLSGIITSSVEDTLTPATINSQFQGLFGKLAQKQVLAKPPDIRSGLGKKQERIDIVNLERFVIQSRKLMVYEESLYEFVPPCWKKLSSRDCSVTLRRLFSIYNLDSSLTSKEYSEIYNLLLCCPDIQVEGHISPPEKALNFIDGTLWLESMEFLPHNPEDHFFTYLDVSYEDVVDCEYGSYFERYMRQVCGEIPEVRRQILELIGLVCTGYQAKVCYYLVGASGTGKTQITRFLEEMIGRENTGTVSGPHAFENKFTIGSLEGKRLAVCMDCPNVPMPPKAIGAMKTFTGGDDSVPAERKHKDSKTIFEKALLLFCSNYRLQVPNVAQEEALLERIIIVPFGKPVEKDAREMQLYRKFISERAYIIAQMIPVYKELMERNYAVTRVPVPKEYIIEEARSHLRIIGDFINDQCATDQHCEISTRDLYDAYLEEMVHLDIEPTSRVDFSRCLSEILRQYPTVTAVKRTNGLDERGYRGIRLKQEL